MKKLAATMVASLHVFAAAPALGDEPAAAVAAAATPASPPRWSLGAGIAFESLGLVSTSLSPGLAPARLVVIPGPAGTLERRLSDRTWLFLNVSGAVERSRSDVPEGSSGYTRLDQRSFTSTVGLRHVLTRRAAPVEVSSLVGVHGGILDGEQRLQTSTGATRSDQTTWFAGASAGIAVERELTDGLALRLSSPLLFGTYSHGSIRAAGEPTRTSTGVSVAVQIRPELELVVFF